MKKRVPPFLAGMLTMSLIGSIGMSALAASGAMTITVDPINIQVNGQTFQPKDATGADVPVFAYNGTTYAPLRALAEAYGLEVGYDQESNMATVTGGVAAPTTAPAPDAATPSTDYSEWSAEEEAAYQEFKGMWEVRFYMFDEENNINHFKAIYTGSESFRDAITKIGRDVELYTMRLAEESFDSAHQLGFSFIVEDKNIGMCIFRIWDNGEWVKTATDLNAFV